MYQDPDTGILWLVYQQYGVPDDFNDYSDDDYANGEIFVTASPPGYYNGLLWAEGINITNTRYDQGGGAPAGECRNEREPSVALNSDGDYLYISYVLDLDAGFVVQGEGDYTENPVVMHRVMKSELIEEMESNGVWLPNVSMHWNEDQYWEDPLEYDWAAHGASFFPDPPPLPELHLLTESLDFGEVLVGGSDTLHVVVENTGDWELVISDVIPGLEAFAVENVNDMVIAPAEIDSFSVVFEPTEAGEYQDTIIIVSDDPDNPETPVFLSGSGSPIPAPFDLSADLDPLTGEVALEWDFNGEGLDAFLEFRLYRNGELRWNGTEASFTDALAEEPVGVYVYRVSALYDEGESALSDSVAVEWEGLNAVNDPEREIPDRWEISAIYPNPFNSTIRISVGAPETARVRAEVFDLLGRRVALLADDRLSAGYHTLTWTADGPSGIYLLLVSAENGWKQTRKLVFIK